MKIRAERKEEREHGGKRIRVTVIERELTPEERLRQCLTDFEARLESLEKEIKKLNMNYRVPDPPQGLQRRRVTAGE